MSKYRNESKIKEIIIHCAATPNGRDFTADDIELWHKENKFSRSDAFIGVNKFTRKHVGYHSVITLDGQVEETRKHDETGAHAIGFNETSLGICMIGTDKFTSEQWSALKNHVQALINAYPTVVVIGHNEISIKLCPGFDVQQWLSSRMRPQDNQIFNHNKEGE